MVIVISGRKEVVISSCYHHVSVSWSCCSKLPQTWRLRTMLYHLPVLEVRIPCIFLHLEEAPAFLGSGAPPSSSQHWPVKSFSCCITHPCFQGRASFSAPACPLPSFRHEAPCGELGPPTEPRIISYFKILNLIAFAKSFLPSKLTDLQVPGTRTWTASGGLILLNHDLIMSQMIRRIYSNSVLLL